MKPAIETQGIGKHYWIEHNNESDRRYVALRDVIAEKLRTLSPAKGKAARSSKEEFWALKDVSFEIDQGERVGIVGRNGAGKSTLLKVLSRITEPTTGRIIMRGRTSSLLEVGTGFHPELTGRENVYLNGAILGMSRIDIGRKFDEIVAFAEVEKFLDTPVKRYSSGMYVRLAFAVAAHLEPDILIVDEVLAVGDAQFQKKCLGKMREVGKDGRTVLFVSHNMGAVKQLCDRGIWLKSGRVESIGPMQEIIDDYMASGDKSSTKIDLTNAKGANGNGEIELLSIEMLNAVGGTFACPWDEPIRFRISLQVNRPLSNVDIALGLMSMDGMLAFTLRTSDTLLYGLPKFETIGRKDVDITIDHNLRAGFFSVMFGIYTGSYSYFQNESLADMEILDTGSRQYLYQNFGFINCDAEWNVLESNEALEMPAAPFAV